MRILGLNVFHADAAAAIVIDGRLVAASEEERFNREKHTDSFPVGAIHYCLAEAGCNISQIDAIAINSDRSSRFWQKLTYSLSNVENLVFSSRRLLSKRRPNLNELLKTAFPSNKIKANIFAVDHHLAHLASAFYCSEFEQAAVASIDGFGDFASAVSGIARPNGITIQRSVLFPHSLGIFYQAVTQYLGFRKYGDEYKVMGLASYGRPRLLDHMRNILLIGQDGSFQLNTRFFRHQNSNITINGSRTEFADLFSQEWVRLFGPSRRASEPVLERHCDIAATAQAMYENALFGFLNRLYHDSGSSNLALAGGCAQNSVANGKILEKTPFKKLFVPPAAGDAGGAAGAAMQIWHRYQANSNAQSSNRRKHAQPRSPKTLVSPYLGPRFSKAAILTCLEQHQTLPLWEHCDLEWLRDDRAIQELTAAEIASGKVIGWFQGRMEWGPRALGNRSILADPRVPGMRDILNIKIKRREEFRPFAPSVLQEHVSEWFERDEGVPFMECVIKVHSEKRSFIPAVTHFDGSARLQTVTAEQNLMYYGLINAFYYQTGVPMLLNTSFNEQEPIVQTPYHALACFERTKMDMLVLGNAIIKRKEALTAPAPQAKGDAA